MKVQLNILTWLANWWFPDVNQSQQAIHELLTKVNKWSVTKGDLWVILHLKEIQLLYTRFFCKDPVYRSDRIIGITKRGLPKGLPILNSIAISGKNQDIRYILTLLSIYRTIKAWKKPDLSTITNSYTGLEFSNLDFDNFINKYFVDNNIKVINLKWSKEHYYYSMKSGPNGRATWMAVLDAISLSDNNLENIKMLSIDLWLEVKQWRTFDKGIFQYLKFKPSDTFKQLSRKISIVKDPGGKSRLIAIIDYWSQNIMKELHNEVFKILATIPTDKTFTQDPRVDFEGPYYSFDLSAATDRFPLALQKRVVRALLNSTEKSEAWGSIMSNQEFYVPWEDKFVKYEVGQPMGAYSSWAIFALSHHIIVQYCAFLIGEYPTKNYILLGDDIVIGGSKLADTYKSIMGALGVGISTHKTHVSINTYEFAKRWFRDGIEISGLQVNAFMETWKSYPLLYQTISTYYKRGLYPKRISSYPILIETLLISLGMYRRKAENISRKVEMLHGFSRWIHQCDMRSIRDVLVSLSPNDASIPNETHPIFQFLMEERFDMAYQVIHQSLVSKVNNFLEKIPDLLINDTTTFDPDRVDEGEIDWNSLNTIGLSKSNSFSYSDIYNLPVSLSLNNVARRLSEDERISIANSDLKDHINALVIPELDDIKSKVRGANVLIKQAILAQKVLHFHKVLAGGAGWMFETQWFSNNGRSLSESYTNETD